METVPLHWKVKSQPLDCQGNPWVNILWTKKQVTYLPWGMVMDRDIWNPVCSGKRRASKVVLVVKNQPAKARDLRDMSLIPGLGRSSEGGHGNPRQCSCLENPMDRGAWQTMVYGVTESDTTEAGTHSALERISSIPLSVQTDCLHCKERRKETFFY